MGESSWDTDAEQSKSRESVPERSSRDASGSIAPDLSSLTDTTSSIQRTAADSAVGPQSPGPDTRGQYEQRYGFDIDTPGQADRLQRLEQSNTLSQVQRWADEGIPIEAMGTPSKKQVFRQRKGTPVPWDIEQQNKRSVQRNKYAASDTSPAGQTQVPDSVRNVVASPGQSLDTAIQRTMEDRMGGSFDDVEVHAGPKAAQAADDINARAFTVGNNIAFNRGEYDPSTAEGQHVLAHELAHVRQQTGGAVSMLPQDDGELEIDPDPQLEREAEETARRVMNGGRLGIQRLADTDVHVQRSPMGDVEEFEEFYDAVDDQNEFESADMGDTEEFHDAVDDQAEVSALGETASREFIRYVQINELYPNIRALYGPPTGIVDEIHNKQDNRQDVLDRFGQWLHEYKQNRIHEFEQIADLDPEDVAQLDQLSQLSDEEFAQSEMRELGTDSPLWSTIEAVEHELEEINSQIVNQQNERRDRTTAARRAAYTLAMIRLALAGNSSLRVPEPCPERDLDPDISVRYRPPRPLNDAFENDRTRPPTDRDIPLTTQDATKNWATDQLREGRTMIGGDFPLQTLYQSVDNAEQMVQTTKRFLLLASQQKYQYGREIQDSAQNLDGNEKWESISNAAHMLQWYERISNRHRIRYYEAVANLNDQATVAMDWTWRQLTRFLSRHPEVDAPELAAFFEEGPMRYRELETERVREQMQNQNDPSEITWDDVVRTELPEEIDIGSRYNIDQSRIKNLIHIAREMSDLEYRESDI